jgi:RNA polymerase sigma factor (sigma-70 family)
MLEANQFLGEEPPLYAIINGCLQSDRSAQARLYDLYSKKMLGVCVWYARSKEEAEEILQDGFLRVFRYIHTFNGEGSFEGWIRKIMVNCALQKIQRSPVLYPIVEISKAEPVSYHDEEIFASLEARELLKLVQSLPPGYRVIFNLFVFEGLKHREIAELLNISEGTSKSNLSDARSWLAKALKRKRIASGE